MTRLLDWITLNSWAVALAAVAFSLLGFAITRKTALRGQSSDDPTPWVAFCMGLYRDTGSEGSEDNSATSDSGDSAADGGD